MFNTKTALQITAMLLLMLAASGCGVDSNTDSPGQNAGPVTSEQPGQETTTPQPEESDGESDATDSNSEQGSTEISIDIDQTQKPITGNSFDFFVKKRPEGYSLTEMQWISGQSEVKNTIQEAVEHGQNGEDGFYISGDGQFSGFFYPDEMKEEKGEVIFLFRNEAGDELIWKKEMILK